MQYSVTQKNSLEDSCEQSGDIWWNLETYDNTLTKQKYKDHPMSPTLRITDENMHDIAFAKIDSYFERHLTPEGNVKYKNYKVLPINVPIRMYTPSGDVNLTPKKGKIVARFELFDDFNSKRDKILSLISNSTPCNEALKEIIKPPALNRKTIETLKLSNPSRLDDYMSFLANQTPSPCFSMFSNDVEHLDISYCATPENTRAVSRQHRSIVSVSVDHNEMCLSDELLQAERCNMRSCTPKSGRKTPSENKRLIVRDFLQRNMILESANRDRLAKLALTIEEDVDEFSCYSIIASTRILQNKIADMLKEIKDLRENLFEIQDDVKVSKL